MNYQTPEITADTDDWAIRSAYWNSKSQLETPKRKRREKAKIGLVLTGHGLSIRVDNGRLWIKDGFTHYPQKPITKIYFKGSLHIPPRIVLVDGKGSITLDALDWLSEQNVNLIRVKWNGQFHSLITSGGQAADPEKFEWQLRTREYEADQLAFFTPLMAEKFKNSLRTLKDYFPASTSRDRAIGKIGDYINKLRHDPPTKLKSLMGYEAQVASHYFATWRTLELNWSATERYPIPDEWRQFYSRQSLAILNRGGTNYCATHPVNSMLNYVYTVLLARMQIQAIADGYDPMLGVIHKRKRSMYGPLRPGFALDIMEPFRPVVDRAVLKLIRDETFSGSDFELQSDGVCRLNINLAKLLLTV